MSRLYPIKSTHRHNWTFLERRHVFAAQNKTEPQSQLSMSAFSSVGHTHRPNTCLWLSGQQRNVKWRSYVIMDLGGATNYTLLPQIYNLVCPGLASLCSANECCSNCYISTSSWVNSFHISCHGTSRIPARWAHPSHLPVAVQLWLLTDEGSAAKGSPRDGSPLENNKNLPGPAAWNLH